MTKFKDFLLFLVLTIIWFFENKNFVSFSEKISDVTTLSEINSSISYIAGACLYSIVFILYCEYSKINFNMYEMLILRLGKRKFTNFLLIKNLTATFRFSCIYILLSFICSLIFSESDLVVKGNYPKFILVQFVALICYYCFISLILMFTAIFFNFKKTAILVTTIVSICTISLPNVFCNPSTVILDNSYICNAYDLKLTFVAMFMTISYCIIIYFLAIKFLKEKDIIMGKMK